MQRFFCIDPVKKRRFLMLSGIIGLFLVVILAKTWSDMRPFPAALVPDPSDIRKVRILDRRGVPLSVTYQNRWNYHDYVPLHDVPPFLQQAFILAEDKRFFDHGGVDWKARMHALIQNIRALRAVRGASTITEQAVRLIHPRPRTVWSRLLEGIEARQLEKRFSKAEILEFYLNQVPYAAQRRGIVQAARYYFNRDLDTLSTREMLALAVLVRAPGRMDLYKKKGAIQKPLSHLAQRMYDSHLLAETQYREVLESELTLENPSLPVQAGHFVQYLYRENIVQNSETQGRLFTTLDASLQRRLQDILDSRLKDLKSRNVTDGALLVVDHRTNKVLAWVNGGGYSDTIQGSKIDAVTTPRQPGSALKPFLYALALEKRWTPATLINDSPLASPVGTGLHAYRNYSRQNYGWLRLRDCLGNSLNVPAVRTVQFVGVNQFLLRLRNLGFQSLTGHPEYYGEGLALGNGEITLFELVQAYATLARRGMFHLLMAVRDDKAARMRSKRIFSEGVSSLIAHILSDPQARRLEFGNGNLLRFPVQTAVKTGTSSDYRDAWSVGFTHRYAAGVWMGNLDQNPMKDVTGSVGPALVLRAVFSELNKYEESEPLFLSPGLTSVKICRKSGLKAEPNCPTMSEWFEPDTAPSQFCPLHHTSSEDGLDPAILTEKENKPAHLIQPTQGLQLAMDPRIPDDIEAFPFILSQGMETTKVNWVVDGKVIGTTSNNTNQFLWNLSRGVHTAHAEVWLKNNKEAIETGEISFVVK